MDREQNNVLARIRRTVEARWTHPVNWTMRGVGVACLGLALLLRWELLAHTGFILVCVSALKLHLPPPRWTLVIRIQTAERNWLDAPWTRPKRLQAATLGLGLAVLVGVLCSGSLALFTLAVGGAGLWLAHRSTQERLRDMDRDEALDRLRDQDREERGEEP